MSLAARLVIASLAIVLAGGILVTVLAWTYGQRAARDAFDRLLLGAADQISASIQLSEGELLVDLPGTAFDLLALSRNDRVVYRVALATGATLTGFDEVPIPEGNAPEHHFDGDITGEPARFVAVTRAFAERDFSGSTITIVGHTLSARNSLAWDIMQNAWFILFLAGIGMTALALFSIRSALNPLRRISRHLLAREPDDVSPITLSVPRELTVFVSAFNRFAGRLRRQMQVMQDLIGDAAHQLRTPIAALRASLRNRIVEAGSPEETAALEKLDEQARCLGRLTDQLLSRALVIHRADLGQFASVDLRQIASDAVESLDPLVPAGEAIVLELPESAVVIRGDALSLAEAVKNLLSNAITYGAAPYAVEVARHDQFGCLAVRDSGNGMEPGHWLDQAQRFGSQQLSARPGGLGLSIVRSVLDAHDGMIEISRTEGERFTVELRFPIRQQPRISA